jgi:hypothetical protein
MGKWPDGPNTFHRHLVPEVLHTQPFTELPGSFVSCSGTNACPLWNRNILKQLILQYIVFMMTLILIMCCHFDSAKGYDLVGKL